MNLFKHVLDFKNVMHHHLLPVDDDHSESPLRAELLSSAQMEQHGKFLAGSHQVCASPPKDRLLGRLAENERVIIEACNVLTAAIKEGRQVTPASEWLLDNFYLIEDQIRTAKRHLPKGYSKQLPRLHPRTHSGYPRVYHIALEIVSHGDGRVGPEDLYRFVAAYQEVTALNLGELWAIPIMLRLALIENLRRVAAGLAASRQLQNVANGWADRMVHASDVNPTDLILLVADMARSTPPMAGAFVAELARRLQGQGPGLTLPMTWIAHRLADTGLTIEQVVQLETQQQAADQVSISNSICSLRFLSTMDWRDFVENLNVVDPILRQDPDQTYARMDFATRDRYRHTIERIARQSAWSEAQVAENALQLAQQQLERGANHGSTHVGFYLTGKGLAQLEQLADMRRTPLQAFERLCSTAPLGFYLGSIGLLSLFFTLILVRKASADGLAHWPVVALGLLAMLAVSHLAVALTNWVSTLLTTPHPLPRMDFSSGIPASASTLVVVPCMLTSNASTDTLCEALEVRFLANRDPSLRFCLLTDFTDNTAETTPNDTPLAQYAQKSIQQLNLKYAEAPFLLLHRPRRWNAQERLWMGYERKRGKLGDLNHLLRATEANASAARAAFSVIEGNDEGLTRVKYVITLDSDTQLPRDTARQFIATMAHPLNQARYDESAQRVTEGYGILQPRVAISLPGSDGSRFERLYGGEQGIDPYTRTVSDVYQDVFREGSFVGKGIYDVDAFERALAQRLPDNRILSHDLLEGCYARAGLISDVQLYEEYPARYQTDVNRRRRWIRGDWQLLAWLLPRVPVAIGDGGAPYAATLGKKHPANPLSALSRWKLFDNLRRSLTPAALLALLLCGWDLLPAAWFWTASVLGIIVIPSMSATLLELVRKPADVLAHQHIRALLRSSGQHLAQALLTLAFLPYEAYFSLDAIVRTCWRMTISGRHLLEWNPYAKASGGDDTTLAAAYRTMWISPALALATGGALIAYHPGGLFTALPILLLWLMAPALDWWISQPRKPAESALDKEQTLYLRQLARKTWNFFETFVGPDDHWLPPDNVQEQPVAVVARRTSPTNIGLALLANLTAYDFGYISAARLVERSHNTLGTMMALERYQGHFFNWYDTQSLKPLLPVYISSVDSGNLAGSLLTLQQGLLALIDQPILSPRLFEGIADSFALLSSMAHDTSQIELAHFQAHLQMCCDQAPCTLVNVCKSLDVLTRHAAAYAATLDAYTTSGRLGEAAASLLKHCQHARNDLHFLAPWITLPLSAEACEMLGGQRNDSAAMLPPVPSLRQLAQLPQRMQATGAPPTLDGKLQALLAESSQRAVERINMIIDTARQAADFARMEYGFLFNPTTHLLAIGYNLTERRLDTSFYDLLASEARLACFVAIAQGQIPQESWFALGRQLTVAQGEPVLVSWSGSMFEYLMPLLIMPTYQSTLLDQTYKATVAAQIAYGKERGVPWGISESGYHIFDAQQNYQYRAFGVPGLGLKRGLGDDLVVAPYASMLALMVAPSLACQNLQRLSAEGFEGPYGLYEAIDYTPSRLPRGQSRAIIRSFMAHHQGMGFLALGYVLLKQPMQQRFAADPLLQATMLLLQERIPSPSAFYSNTTELADIRTTANEQAMPMRILKKADSRIPETQLLSNGRYHVMISSAGGSYSRWKDLALTRWHEDSTCDNWGVFLYVRDVADGVFWSSAHQPTGTAPDAKSYEVIFSEGRAEFRRKDKGFDMHTEIVVSPEDDIELRRTRITNRSRQRRTIDVTSYAEVVLAPAAADAAHPAFSNLFLQTEIVPEHNAILCTRRPRSAGEAMPLMVHMMAVHDARADAISFETDRMQFIGRNQSVAAPQAMLRSGALSGRQGSVLDPIVAIRYQITLEPEQAAVIDMVTGVADTREGVIHLMEKYQDRNLADRVFELAWTHSQVVLRQLNASEADAQLYGRLANSVIYANPALRADASVLGKNVRGQSGLWSYSISGDLPIVLCQIKDPANIELVRQLVQAHAYWRLKGLAVDLVILYEDHSGYRQLLQEQIMGLIASGIEAQTIDRPGGIFVRLADQIANEDRILLQSVARAILIDSRGTLADQINRRSLPGIRLPQLIPTRTAHGPAHAVSEPVAAPPRELLLFNGLGGFTPDGREYVITTQPDQLTPAPWVNVLANPNFGTVISDSGQAYSWGENAHEFRLTPWHNDPVSDGSGEALYLRDEQSGQFWSPTALPRRGSGTYTTRHGFGYSIFEHTEQGITSELTVYVALDASIKYSVLKVRNDSAVSRKLSATGYVEWVMGDLRAKSGMHIITETEPGSGALFARNPYNTEFAGRIAFFDVDATSRSITCDRSEFIGRNGSLRNPAALYAARLSGKSGPGLDPCAAIQVPFELEPGQTREITFMLGMTRQRSADVSDMVRRYRGSAAARAALEAVHRHWRHTLGAVQITTPDPALNILTNGWLMYQTIACRLWARSGYYQSGGAYGFRDQLQDVMALIHTEPHLVRDHLLLCAAHQFIEGDVQHWWHPPSNRGVRTHCSDDYLWLPLAIHRYVISSADHGVLEETAHFLEGRAVNPGEDSYYDLPARSNETATLYQHGVRAILRGLRFGEHGLPLMGSCDWNDGMDKVGALGKGESVWLGFFLYDVLLRFAEIAQIQQDAPFVTRCHEEAATLRANLEQHAWDGAWYRRAYFDDGTPLGSSSNEECQIDSISQSWAVLSGAGNPDRVQQAMASVDRRLVRRDDRLVQLLDPPFDHSDLNPGYIRGYVPGVRENGGQYTHAAIWTAMAFAKLGDNARAWELTNMINPINHGSTAADIAVYKVEPYVLAADVYGNAPHIGRGGWTWYTGSSGWMYRLITESLLGLTLTGETLCITPCWPLGWGSFSMQYRFRQTLYEILVLPTTAQAGVTVDGVLQNSALIHLTDDRGLHHVEIRVNQGTNNETIPGGNS
jgi:cellobiose phosphorylase